MSSSIIKDLIDEGVVALYFDPRSGSFRDWSGNGNHVVPTAPTHLRRNGANLNHSGQMDIASALSMDVTGYAGSSIMAYWPEGFSEFVGAVNYIWTVPGAGFYFGGMGGSDRLLLKIGGTTAVGAGVTPNGKHSLSFSWSGGYAPDFYANGLFYATGSAILNQQVPAATAVALGSVITAPYTQQLPSTFGAVLATSRALTATEQALVDAELRSYDESWPQKVFARNRGYVDINPAETGLVAGWNMKPVAGQIIDLSPNGNDGDIVGATFKHSPIGPALDLDGVSDYVNCGAGFQALTDVTVSMWFKPKELTRATFLFNYYFSAADRWSVRLISGPTSGICNLDIYDDIDDVGVPRYSLEIREGLWHHIAAQLDNLENKLYLNGALIGSGEYSSDDWSSFAGLLYLGSGTLASGFAPTEMAAPKAHSRVLTPAEIAAEYQDGARAILFKTDWGARETVANVTENFISNTPFVVGGNQGGGTWKIVTEEIDGMQCKVLECVTAGFCYLPTSIFQVGDTQAAYGTWEWYMSKAADSYSQVAFVANEEDILTSATMDGYMFRFSDTERAELIRIDNGVNDELIQTPATAYSVSTWYKIRVARTNAGAFSVYVDDTPIDPTGGSGANPVTDTTYTEAKFVLIDLDAGDKISLGDLKGDHAFIKYLGAVVFSTDGDFPAVIPPV